MVAGGNEKVEVALNQERSSEGESGKVERVGVAAVEDDGIYFAVASVDKEVISWASEPQPPVARLKRDTQKTSSSARSAFIWARW
jgi:hypothetical protein